jgi:hypothetical protein
MPEKKIVSVFGCALFFCLYVTFIHRFKMTTHENLLLHSSKYSMFQSKVLDHNAIYILCTVLSFCTVGQTWEKQFDLSLMYIMFYWT